MKKLIFKILLQLIICSIMSLSLLAQNHPIYVGQRLSPGYDIGVNTSNGQTGWLSDSLSYMKMVYPSNQTWGAVFITVGVPTNSPRPYRNFAMYRSISLEMKGAKVGENVDIGIKDNTDLDNGQETKIAVTLTIKWKEYEFLLNRFVTADLSHLYVPIEFVFGDLNGSTVYFKNIKYKQ
ncbi:MAG: hypothetical protein ABSF81_02645 [Bacteroidales bacterium]